MPILNSLLSTADALRAFDRVLDVTQNNVANVATPGFVKQRQTLANRPFDPNYGSLGGLRAGEIASSRDLYVEQSVRRQTTLLGRDQQNVNSLTALEAVFDISGDFGIPHALNNLFDSFSAWAQQPSDGIARQNVLDRAENLAQAFHQTADGVAGVTADAERQIQHTVDAINGLAQTLRGLNAEALRTNRGNPSLDTEIHAILEELSQYVEITALHQEDGSVTVLLNGQTPLVVADRQYAVNYRLEIPATPPPVYASARPVVRLTAADGADVTAATTGGKLGALLDFRNRVIASYAGDAWHQGDLNHMAEQLSARVNDLLASGGGPPLFTFDVSNPTAIAQTMAVNPAIGASQLAAVSPGPPVVSNGIPLALAALSHPLIGADEIDGVSYTEFYGSLAGRVGRALSDAKAQARVQQSTRAQAKELREQMSGVSLDEEAVIMIQFQRAYEANSRFITVLDRLTQVIIDMLR